MKREPAVAGRFYPAAAEVLRSEIEGFLAAADTQQPAAGCLVPHAGYMFSGATAGKVLGRIAIPSTVVIMSPNHTGRGVPFSLWNGGGWDTPLGECPVDTGLRDRISAISGAEPDEAAHLHEHSIEVIVPFLQVLNPDVRIVPLTISCHQAGLLTAFGTALAGIIEPADALVVASSDMTHMEPAETAREKDLQCVARMEAIDPEGLFELVTGQGISMCGICPATVLMSYLRAKGAAQGTLIEYTNSGEITGDMDRVVGYAGMVF